MKHYPSLLHRTDWSDLPKILSAALAIGGAFSLVLRVLVQLSSQVLVSEPLRAESHSVSKLSPSLRFRRAETTRDDNQDTPVVVKAG